MIVYHGRTLDTHQTHTIFTRDTDPRPVYVAWYCELGWWMVPEHPPFVSKADKSSSVVLQLEDDMDDEDDVVAEVTFCTYGVCADRAVPCPSCTTIEVKGEKEDG